MEAKGKSEVPAVDNSNDSIENDGADRSASLGLRSASLAGILSNEGSLGGLGSWRVHPPAFSDTPSVGLQQQLEQPTNQQVGGASQDEGHLSKRPKI